MSESHVSTFHLQIRQAGVGVSAHTGHNLSSTGAVRLFFAAEPVYQRSRNVSDV